MNKLKVSTGVAQKEIDRLDAEFNAKQQQMSSLSQDEMNKAPIAETEHQTKLSKQEVKQYDAPEIKPSQTIPGIGKRKPEQDNLRRRAWELVKVVAENCEVIGEKIELWHKAPFSGEPCTFWQIPVNKPIYIPRFLADHLMTRNYHRLVMQETPVENNQYGQVIGQMIASETRRRLDCRIVGF